MKNFYSFIFIMLTLLCKSNAHAQIGYQVSLLNSATGEPRANVTVNATITITNSEDGLVYSCTQPSTSNDFGVLTFTIGNQDTFKNVDWTKLPFFIEVQVDGNTIGKSQILTVPVAEYAKSTGQLTKEILKGTWVFEETSFRPVHEKEGHYDAEGNESYTYYTYKMYYYNHVTLSFNENEVSYNYSGKYWTEGKRWWDSPDDYSYDYNSFVASGSYYIDGNDVILVLTVNKEEHGPVGFYETYYYPYEASTNEYNAAVFHYIPEKNLLCGRVHDGGTGVSMPLKKQ